MAKEVAINTENLKSYIKASNIPMEIIRKDVPKIEDILEGKKKPTFNQISKIAKRLNLPTGVLLLKQKIDSTATSVNFRTINSQTIDDMSPELRDTILEMQEKQEFLKSEIEDSLDFVGSFTINDSSEDLLHTVQAHLGMDDRKKRLEKYREKISQAGVFVFFNGKVKDNSHRKLDLSEFRGFALSDSKAPIIFINQRDSKTGRLFTLIHEFVHLFLGDSDLYTSKEARSSNSLEALVNKVTGEILVPKQELNNLLTADQTYRQQLSHLAHSFEVSQYVITRRLLDCQFISQKEYDAIIKELDLEFESSPKRKEDSGGNYRLNLNFRMDHNFFNYVNNAVLQNKITYTDAFNIVGVGYKGYQALLKGGKIAWNTY